MPGVQFSLDFDGSLLSASSVQEGGLLTQGGTTTFFNPGGISTGSVSGVAGAIITPGETVSGAGTFATITFTAGTQDGTSPLTLSGVVVGDIGGKPVAGEPGPVQGILAFLNPLLCRSTPVVEVHHALVQYSCYTAKN